MRDRGLLATLLALSAPPVTVSYPREREAPVSGARGSVGFFAERCTACERCVAVCPTACLHIAGDAREASPAQRLEVSLDRGACILCGACIEACPTGALVWRGADEHASAQRAALVAGIEQLRPEEAADEDSSGRGATTPHSDRGAGSA